jgi:hypothetical protein
MSLDDLLEPEVMIAVGVTAAVMSPPVRKVLRKGAVYGLAGMLMLGDKIAGAARGISQGAQNLAASARETAQETTSQTGRPAVEPAAS